MLLMGVDIGTSGAKCVAVDPCGDVIARATYGYPLETPKPGWAEQRPQDWYDAAVHAIREVLSAPGVSPSDIAGIAFSGQMHGLVPFDAEGRIIRKAILWCDQRTQKQCREIELVAGSQKALLQMTNNVMLTGYTGGKLLWLKEEEPDHFRAMTGFLCPKDALRYFLTGKMLMDVTEASGTGLFDTKHRSWREDLIRAIGLPLAIFPDVVESTELAGSVTAEASRATGLLAGTPCFAGGGDAVVQSFGSGLIREGTVGTVIGTAGNVSMGFQRFTENPGGKLQMFCGIGSGSYVSFGATQTAGGALRWFRDELARDLIQRAKEEARDVWSVIDQVAGSSSPGANGIVFAPYLSGERCPYPDPDARAVLYGMSLSTKQADMIRAVMEGIVCSLRQIVEIYRSFSRVDAAVASGGGAASNLFLQMQADAFKMPVRTVSAASEGGAYGAALIAGLGIGLFRTVEDAVSVLHTESKHDPDPVGMDAADKTFAVYKQIYPAMKPIYALSASLY